MRNSQRRPKAHSRLTSIHGAPDAKIVSSGHGSRTASAPVRRSMRHSFRKVALRPSFSREVVVYTDGQPSGKAHSSLGGSKRLHSVDRILLLTGNPRVADGGMTTTAKTIRINRATDDAFADGNVKSTYSDLKEQPNGALLASSSPIHVTAATMTAHNSPAIALYEGNARLWQDANIIEAPSIEFDRDRRSVDRTGKSVGKPVSTVLVQQKLIQPESSSRPGPVSDRSDSRRK